MPRSAPEFSQRRLTEIGRAVVDARFIGIVVWDADDRIVEANPAMAELLGYSSSELTRRTWAELTPRRYQTLHRRAAEALCKDGRFPPYEKCLLRADGTEAPVLVGGAALGSAGGGIGFILDLTERQATQDALQMSEEQFRALARNVPGVVYLCDHDRWQPFRFVNEGVEQLTGVAARRFCDGRASFRDLLHADDAPRVAQSIQAALGRGRPFHVVYRLKHASGEWRWVEEHGQGVGVEGELRFIEGVILDVTAHQQAEEAIRAAHSQLRAAHDELEDRVRERTASLRKSNQKLRQERAFLRRTLDQQERHRQLVAYDIHDGLAQYITGAVMQLETFAAQVESAGNSAAARLSKRARATDATKPPSQREHLDTGLKLLRKSLDEARRLISGLRPPILDEKGLVAAIEYLISELPPSPWEIHFVHDVRFERLPPLWESNLFRIVQEALNNATQHGQATAVHVELVQNRKSLRLTVTDNGQGFDAKQVPERRHGLQGIRQRARLLGGKAAVRSAAGQGTRISVTLPLPEE